MNWYQGDISQAIVTSKQKGAVFVVYIEGKDEKSTHFNQLINEKTVAEKLGSDNFVAIKIEANTLPHQQFSQFYNQTPVPSIYFIGKQGTPIEIITEAKDRNTLNENVDKVLEKAGISIQKTSTKQSQDFIQTEQAAAAASTSCENGVCTLKPSSNNVENDAKQEEIASNDNIELSTDEKVERAKQLLEKKREEKRKEEEESNRLKEIERRKMGQNVQQLKRWQDDQELKQVLEEREKEKRENQAARDRVLAQIAQDKAERAAKFSGTNVVTASSSNEQPKSTSSPQPPRQSFNSDIARIQFKVPDGKSVTHDFQCLDTLQTVHDFIRENINLPFNPYTLSTTFPRREFTSDDSNRSLAELELIPTAVLLILPAVGSSSSSSVGISNVGITSLFWALIAPIFSILGMVKNFIFGAPSTSSNGENKRPAEAAAEKKSFVKRRAKESTVIKRHGNIHRLSNENDSDDDTNTWNGNSTQQM